jgi:hypothetical protein
MPLEPVVLDAQAVEQLLAVAVEPIGQPLDVVRELGGPAAPVGAERDGGRGQNVVEIGLEALGDLLDPFVAGLAAPVSVEGEQDDQEDDGRVDHGHGREGRRQTAQLPAESLLPEEKEGLADLVGVVGDVARVRPGGLVQGVPGEENRNEDEDLPGPVGDLEGAGREGAFAPLSVGRGQALGVERPTQVNIRPADAPLLGADRPGQVAQPFGRAGVDLTDRGGHPIEIFGEFAAFEEGVGNDVAGPATAGSDRRHFRG